MLKRTLVSFIALGTFSAGIFAAVPAHAANVESPSGLASQVILNAKNELSVRVVSSETTGAQKISIVTDAGRLGGVQRVTLRRQGATSTGTAELIDNIIYVKGDTTFLEHFMDLPKATSDQLSNLWFYIKSGGAEYDQVAQGLTIASGMSEVALQKKVRSLGTKMVDRTKVTELVGLAPPVGTANRETMFVSTSRRPLPVEVVQSESGRPVTITFSRWNENISLSAPDAKFQLT
jgi:hypothetical protein